MQLDGTSQHNKAHVWIPTGNIILNEEKQKEQNIYLKNRNKTRIFDFTTLIKHSTRCSNHSNHMKRRNKRHPSRKGRNQKIPWNKWKWEHNNLNSMGHGKSNPKREIHSNIKKQEKSQKNTLTLHLKVLEKE